MIAIFSEVDLLFSEEKDGRFSSSPVGPGLWVAKALFSMKKRPLLISSFARDSVGGMLKAGVEEFASTLPDIDSDVSTGISISFSKGVVMAKGTKASSSLLSDDLSHALSGVKDIRVMYLSTDSLSKMPLASTYVDGVTFYSPKPVVVLEKGNACENQNVLERTISMLDGYVDITLESGELDVESTAELLKLLDEGRSVDEALEKVRR